MKRNFLLVALCLACACVGLAARTTRAAAPPQKDYLSQIESDKIRDAESPNERITLFLSFADDRLKKLQYEFDHPSESNHIEMINSLLNAYIGCVDDAADLIQLGIEKQQNIRKGVNLMATRSKDYLVILQKIPDTGAEAENYKDNLEDAIEGTLDASREADDAKKNVAPPPVRRKH